MIEGESYWPRLIKSVRARENLTQAALASWLGVDQTTVSRWERGQDAPAFRLRQRIRDLYRQRAAGKQDLVARARVRNALWPASLVGPGAVFIEFNARALSEIGVEASDLRGRSIYGLFGPDVDCVTERWESTGIFQGELAMTVSLNRIESPGRTAYIKTLDTPHFTWDGDIWCLCEIQRISEAEHARLMKEFGGSNFALSFDALHP
ncbi:MAG: helix-turn-helix domain-containing protein [Alphaproteobacteria bacterium]|nr:helix-turn-helix domain-containing protein [Alphaproteobacteria bacterium]